MFVKFKNHDLNRINKIAKDLGIVIMLSYDNSSPDCLIGYVKQGDFMGINWREEFFRHLLLNDLSAIITLGLW